MNQSTKRGRSRTRASAPVIATDQAFAEFIVRVVLPKLRGATRAVLARDVGRALRRGHILRSRLALDRLGLDLEEALDACAAILCALTGQPLIVQTPLGAIGMPNHVRLDIYFFDEVETGGARADGVFWSKMTKPPRPSEDALFDRLYSMYGKAAEARSAVKLAPRGDARVDEGSRVVAGVHLRWRHAVMPVLSREYLRLHMRASLVSLFEHARNEAIVAMILKN